MAHSGIIDKKDRKPPKQVAADATWIPINKPPRPLARTTLSRYHNGSCCSSSSSFSRCRRCWGRLGGAYRGGHTRFTLLGRESILSTSLLASPRVSDNQFHLSSSRMSVSASSTRQGKMTISDPQKQGEGMSQYISYKVIMEVSYYSCSPSCFHCVVCSVFRSRRRMRIHQPTSLREWT